MENMILYTAFQAVPKNAQKLISGGRLKGMTDINPMWRIKVLTEQFGPCGFGWKYVIKEKRLDRGSDNEVAAFIDIDLYYKIDGKWSEPVPGTGGAMFVAKERSGAYVSDECFKMALTDAISVSCKAIGIGADVYWQAGSSKYNNQENTQQEQAFAKCNDCQRPVNPFVQNGKIKKTSQEMIDYTMQTYGVPLCCECAAARKSAQNGSPN